MRSLTYDEIENVSGGVNILDSTAYGGGGGSLAGLLLTNTARGAAYGGAVGAAGGFAFGVGYYIGTKLYEYLCQ